MHINAAKRKVFNFKNCSLTLCIGYFHKKKIGDSAMVEAYPRLSFCRISLVAFLVSAWLLAELFLSGCSWWYRQNVDEFGAASFLIFGMLMFCSGLMFRILSQTPFNTLYNADLVLWLCGIGVALFVRGSIHLLNSILGMIVVLTLTLFCLSFGKNRFKKNSQEQ